jgi:hypothetical protein
MQEKQPPTLVASGTLYEGLLFRIFESVFMHDFTNQWYLVEVGLSPQFTDEVDSL